MLRTYFLCNLILYFTCKIMLSNVLKFLKRPDLEAMCPRSLFRHQVPCGASVICEHCYIVGDNHFLFWCLTPQGALYAMMGYFWTGAANFSDYTRPGCERWEGRENFPMGRKSAWLSVDKIIASCAKGFCGKTLSAFLEIGSSSPLQMPHLTSCSLLQLISFQYHYNMDVDQTS